MKKDKRAELHNAVTHAFDSVELELKEAHAEIDRLRSYAQEQEAAVKTLEEAYDGVIIVNSRNVFDPDHDAKAIAFQKAKAEGLSDADAWARVATKFDPRKHKANVLRASAKRMDEQVEFDAGSRS